MKIFILSIVFFSLKVFAWGERGHHTVGYAAAISTQVALTTEEKVKLGTFFSERTFQFGHLNNIPDISWKRPGAPKVKINAPTHYLDTEVLLGLPTNGYDEEYLNRVRNLEKDYEKLSKQFDNKLNPLPGAIYKNISVYFDVGTAPWRVQELYNQLVEAFACAAKKPVADKKPSADFKYLLNSKYVCTKQSTRLENVYAAVAIAGVMGHFVADLTQPYHATTDFDGWVTGQGGVHVYFETFVFQALNESFLSEVSELSSNKSNNEKIWERLGALPSDKYFATQTMLNLAAESLKHFSEVQELDRKKAVITTGDKVPWGGRFGKIPAERKPVTDAKVRKAFEPIIKERIVVGSVLLSRLWVEAWRQGGSPDLADISLVKIPYVLDVPFLNPSYIGKAAILSR